MKRFRRSIDLCQLRFRVGGCIWWIGVVWLEAIVVGLLFRCVLHVVSIGRLCLLLPLLM